MTDPSEIVRIDRELGAMLACPSAEALQRIMQAYELSDRQHVFVGALVMRLLVARDMRGAAEELGTGDIGHE